MRNDFLENMNSEEFMRHKMLQHEFSFQPEAWAKLESSLPSTEKRRKKIVPMYRLGLPILGVLLASVLFSAQHTVKLPHPDNKPTHYNAPSSPNKHIPTPQVDSVSDSEQPIAEADGYDNSVAVENTPNVTTVNAQINVGIIETELKSEGQNATNTTNENHLLLPIDAMVADLSSSKIIFQANSIQITPPSFAVSTSKKIKWGIMTAFNAHFRGKQTETLSPEYTGNTASATFENLQLKEPSVSVGYSLGAFVEVPIASDFSVRVEPRYTVANQVNFLGNYNDETVQSISSVGQKDETAVGGYTRYGKLTYNASGTVTRRLHFVDLPVSVNYNFSKKHNVYMGFRASYLAAEDAVAFVSSVSQNCLISPRNEIQILDGTAETHLTEKQGSNSQYFNKLDMGFALGYSVQVSKNFSVGVEYNQAFKRLAKKESFAQSNYRNSNISLTARYSFL